MLTREEYVNALRHIYRRLQRRYNERVDYFEKEVARKGKTNKQLIQLENDLDAELSDLREKLVALGDEIRNTQAKKFGDEDEQKERFNPPDTRKYEENLKPLNPGASLTSGFLEGSASLERAADKLINLLNQPRGDREEAYYKAVEGGMLMTDAVCAALDKKELWANATTARDACLSYRRLRDKFFTATTSSQLLTTDTPFAVNQY